LLSLPRLFICSTSCCQSFFKVKIESLGISQLKLEMWITFLVVAFVRLDFSLHDRAVAICCETLGELRIEQMTNYSYDCQTGKLDINEVLGTPILGAKKAKISYVSGVKQRAENYYQAKRIGNSTASMNALSTEMDFPKKNAGILRAGTKVIQLIGKETDS